MEKDAYYYYIAANEYYNNDQIEEAIHYFLKSLDLNYHFKTYEQLYWCYSSLQQHDLANYFIKRAYEENDRNDKVAYLYAKVLINKNNYIVPVKYSAILKRNPGYKKAEQIYLEIMTL